MEESHYRFLTSIVGFLLVIGPAVFIHELGHFLVAKKFGIKVFTFSLGFGPKIFSWHRGGTEYRISWIPLGGYVKMAGEEPNEPRAGSADEFASKPVWQRSLVILAGPIANIILGFFICVWIYASALESQGFLRKIGMIHPESPAAGALEVGDEIVAVNGQPVETWFEIEKQIAASPNRPVEFVVKNERGTRPVTLVPEPVRYTGELSWLTRAQIAVERRISGDGTLKILPWVDPVVGRLIEDGAAEKAGMLPGDRILAVADTPVNQFQEITGIIRASRGETLVFSILRGGEKITIPVKPKLTGEQKTTGDVVKYYAVGMTAVAVKNPQSLLEAIPSAVFGTARMGTMIVMTLKKLVRGEISLKLLSGPVGIAQGSGVQLRAGGLETLAHFLAIISINLGVVNLFPIPLLDGGWLFFFLLPEAVMKRPVPQKVQERMMQVGLVFLLALIIFITYNDLSRVLGYQKVEQILEEEVQDE